MCSNMAANGRLESLCILWCMCILVTCFVDASDMVYVHEPIYTWCLAIDLSLTECYVSLLLHGMPSPDVDEVESDEECSKPKMQFSLLQSRAPTHVEPHPCPLEAVNFLLSLA